LRFTEIIAMSRRDLTAWLLLLPALLQPARAEEHGLPGPIVPTGFGVNIHFTDPAAGEMERFAEAGYRLARMDLSWGAVERTPGDYNFAAYDRLVAHLARAGARPLFILDYGNRLYDGGRSPYTEAGRAAFARYAAAAAAHFRGKGVLWEIWNEPNLAQFWKPAPSADDYVRLALTTGRAVRAADPDAAILAPGSSGFPWEFFETVFRGGVLEQIDAVSVHPYRGGPPESAADDFGRLRALIARYAPEAMRALPIVSSEWGYSTTTAGGVSEDRQAQYLTRMWLANLAAGVNLSIFYDWRDDGNDPREREHRFGTVRRDLQPKPSFQAARALIAELNGFAYRQRIRGRGPDDWQLLLQRGDTEELALVTWNAGRDAPDALTAPAVRNVRPGDSDFDALLALGSVRYRAGALTEATDRAAGIDVTVVNPGRRAATFTIEIGDRAVTIPGPSLQPVTRRVTLPVPDARDERREVSVRILRDGAVLPELEPLTVWRIDPLRLTAAPRAGVLDVTIENPARAPFLGTLALVDGEIQTYSERVTIGAGSDSVDVGIARTARTHLLVLKDTNSRTVATLGPRRYEPMAEFPTTAGTAAGFELMSFVENSPRARTPLETVAAGADAPAPLALAIRYAFEPGWQYVQTTPKPAARIPGGARALTLWARSTAAGDHLRSRYRDATGQTFQVDLGRLGWSGWRPLVIPLDGSHAGAHWGGAGDGVPHAPLVWEGLVLIDSAHRDAGHNGEVLIASPFYIFSER
jgi:hypothetical protein